MNNYKIKLNNEAESREAQDLFEQLGFTWASDYPENGDWYSHLYAEKSSCCHLAIYVRNGLGDKFQELTLPQLRDLVAQSKNEQGLISGADALRALADGDYVEYWCEDLEQWVFMDMQNHFKRKFRLKPRTITLSLEIPAPFEPKVGEVFFALYPTAVGGYSKMHITDQKRMDDYAKLGAWRTEEQVKQVVAALRGGIKA